jgi:hypothetical protein
MEQRHIPVIFSRGWDSIKSVSGETKRFWLTFLAPMLQDFVYNYSYRHQGHEDEAVASVSLDARSESSAGCCGSSSKPTPVPPPKVDLFRLRNSK